MPVVISSRVELLSVKTLIMGIEENKIIPPFDLCEAYNRIRQTDKMDFIISLMTGFPILPLVFDGTVRPWRILDGVKRLALIWAFYNNEFHIDDTRYMFIGGEKCFDDMPLYRRRRFLSARIPCYIINPPTKESTVDDIENKIRRTL